MAAVFLTCAAQFLPPRWNDLEDCCRLPPLPFQEVGDDGPSPTNEVKGASGCPFLSDFDLFQPRIKVTTARCCFDNCRVRGCEWTDASLDLSRIPRNELSDPRSLVISTRTKRRRLYSLMKSTSHYDGIHHVDMVVGKRSRIPVQSRCHSVHQGQNLNVRISQRLPQDQVIWVRFRCFDVRCLVFRHLRFRGQSPVLGLASPSERARSKTTNCKTHFFNIFICYTSQRQREVAFFHQFIIPLFQAGCWRDNNG